MKKLTNNSFSKQKGFTLIELVVVIVILGILAATAAPKFIDIQDDANTATLQAVKASMNTASALVFSKSLIAGNQDKVSVATTGPSVQVNGSPLAISYGYPLVTYNETTFLGSWEDMLIEVGDFDTKVVTGVFYVYLKDATVPTASAFNCTVSYEQAASAGATPTITVTPCS